MERIKRIAELLHEFERDTSSVLGVFDRVGSVLPRAYGSPWTKRIGQRVSECVPIDDAKPQMVAHRFATYFFVRVVVPERQRIFRSDAFEGDALDFWKCGFHRLPDVLEIEVLKLAFFRRSLATSELTALKRPKSPCSTSGMSGGGSIAG